MKGGKTMGLKNCEFCKNQVPEGGQCNNCGFIDGIRKRPSADDFFKAREINTKHQYKQYVNIDMIVMQEERALKQ
ncbi:MAG: hypothetical protein QW594_00840 [Candidatus Woesearchaeota archaeon]